MTEVGTYLETMPPESIALMLSVEELYEIFEENINVATLFDQEAVVCVLCHRIAPIVFLKRDTGHPCCRQCANRIEFEQCKHFSAEVQKILVACPFRGCRQLCPIGKMMGHVKKVHWEELRKEELRKEELRMKEERRRDELRKEELRKEELRMKEERRRDELRREEFRRDELYKEELRMKEELRKQEICKTKKSEKYVTNIARHYDELEDEPNREQMNPKPRGGTDKLPHEVQEAGQDPKMPMAEIGKGSKESFKHCSQSQEGASTSYWEDLSQLDPNQLVPVQVEHFSAKADSNKKSPAGKEEGSSPRHGYQMQQPINPDFRGDSEKKIGGLKFDSPAGVHASHQTKIDSNFADEFAVELLKQNPELMTAKDDQKHTRRKIDEKWSAQKRFDIPDYSILRANERINKRPSLFEMVGFKGFKVRVEVFADGVPEVAGKFMSVRVRLMDSSGVKDSSCCKFLIALRVGDVEIGAHQGTMPIPAGQSRFLDFRNFVAQDAIEHAITSIKQKVVLEVIAKM